MLSYQFFGLKIPILFQFGASYCLSSDTLGTRNSLQINEGELTYGQQIVKEK